MKHLRNFFQASLLVVVLLSLIAGSALAVELVPAGAVAVTSPRTSTRGIDLGNDESIVYAAGIQDRSVVRVTLATNEVTKASLTAINPGAYGKAVEVDSLGRVWAPLTIPMLALYSADLELQAAFDLAPFGIVNPEGVLVTLTEEIYLTDRKGTPGIYKFKLVDNKLVLVSEWGENGRVDLGDLRSPVLTASGDLLLSSHDKGELYLVGADGTISVLAKVNKPFDVAIDDAGLIYVVHYDRKDAGLTVLKPDGSLVQTWTPAELGTSTEISGVAVSKDGKRVYIQDQRTTEGGLVKIYDLR